MEKLEPELGHKLRPPDLQPGALPLSYPGSPASSLSNSPLEITATTGRAPGQRSGGPEFQPGSNFSLEI